MPTHRTGHRAAALLSTLAALSLAGCGLQPATSADADVAPGSIEPLDLPDDASLTVTGKNFTEQLILGKLAVLTAEAAGFDVQDMSGLPGSVPVRRMMLSGEAQVHWDYTGAAWLTYLGQEQGIPDPRGQWEAVRAMEQENGLTWLEPSGLNNAYAIAVNSEFAQEHPDFTTISQIADLPVEERTFCVEAEFNSRSDGLTPMLEHYGIARGAADGVPESNIEIVDTGALYEAVSGGQCTFGEVFASDGRIPQLDLTVLEDDRKFFPDYSAAVVVNTETLEKHPQLAHIYGRVSDALTTEDMRELNRRVDVEGESPTEVAQDWMVEHGFISAG